MTEEDENADPLTLADLIASGEIDVAYGTPPIPISVWRAGNTDPRYRYELSPPLAAALIGYYTDPGDTVISVGHDPALDGAAGAGGRAYRWVAAAEDLGSLLGMDHAIALIVMPWPPPEAPEDLSRDRLVRLLRACQELLAGGGYTVVAVVATGGDTYAEHTAPLLPAARTAGLHWTQHIVAISETAEPFDDPGGEAVRIELLIFAADRRRHG